MLPNTTVVLNNNIEFCEYLNSNQTRALYDCSNVKNDEPFVLKTSFVSPAGTDLTLKNLNLSLASSVQFEAVGPLTFGNVTMTGETGCFITVGKSPEDASDNLSEDSSATATAKNPLTIKSGSFSTSDEKVTSPICYRPSIVESQSDDILSELEISDLLRSIIPETSAYFSETDSSTREEVTEIIEFIAGVPFVKGYINRAFGLNSSKLIVDEPGRGETPEEPETPTETPSEPTVVTPKAPNTAVAPSSPSAPRAIETVIKIFKNITKIILTRYI